MIFKIMVIWNQKMTRNGTESFCFI